MLRDDVVTLWASLAGYCIALLELLALEHHGRLSIGADYVLGALSMVMSSAGAQYEAD